MEIGKTVNTPLPSRGGIENYRHDFRNEAKIGGEIKDKRIATGEIKYYFQAENGMGKTVNKKHDAQTKQNLSIKLRKSVIYRSVLKAETFSLLK
jgi:hypothetical protein